MADQMAGTRLSVQRVAATGAAGAAIIFILCWLGLFIPSSSPTHSYVSLFTSADMTSLRALGEGSLWSLLFGGLSGGVLALIYNLFGALDRRQG